MSIKTVVVKDSSGQICKMLGNTAASISKSNSIPSPLLAKTRSDIVDFFNAGEQDFRNRQ